MEEIKYCKICKKRLIPENTYKFKDGTLDQCCKMCRIAGCTDTRPWTFFPVMELFDIPYVEEEWLYTLRSAFQSRTYKIAFPSIFGKYLAKMYLKGWRNFGFKNSREINFWRLLNSDNKEKFKILRDFLLSKYSLDYQQFPDEYLEIIGIKEKKDV